jgi:hypothetical protein
MSLQTTEGETAQQQTQTLNQLHREEEEKKNTARTSKAGTLPNLPLIEGARRRDPSGLRF